MQYSWFLNYRRIYIEKNSWGKATQEFYSTKSPIAYTLKLEISQPDLLK